MASAAKVLVVEDNELTRRSLVGLLENNGFEVATAEDGKQALRFLRGQPSPDVIILDMLLPRLDGWHVLKEVDGLSLRPKPWIIIVTGAPGLTREWAANHGCGGFLRKPIDEDELIDEIHRCLHRTVEDKL